MPHLLIVDDDQAIRELLGEIGRHSGYSVSLAASVEDAVRELERQPPQLVLTDVRLPGASGLDIFRFMAGVRAEVVVITGYGSMDTAVEALRRGASDYLVKPVEMERLQHILDRVSANSRHAPAAAPDGSGMGAMRGTCPSMQQVYTQIARVAPTQATVLLVGESGTGKELAAQAIHASSLRSHRALIAVNCGAISPNLIESELFGHERGSFTGADRLHRGYFERADGGTLFLDEVTEMPLALQVKLLRVLETGQFMRVGTTREIACDFRLIAATNRNPEQAVQEGRLREDLYYRLNVFPLELPPLRERGPDVLLLAEHFLERENAAAGTRKTFSAAAREAIAAYGWPGNVRELKNYVRRAFIMAENDQLQADVLQPQACLSGADPGQVSVPVGASLAEAERHVILATLARCNGVRKQAAAVLGISPKTLYNRLEEYASAGHELPTE
ncbi:sigma-54 dependent transcriptional regulator [Orrella sp. JC864]|uniref:sigma-54-dependent transcriptional regulator n=1 Tax=Orrella sp. JC864 TaxID=3120298 RepID=UPI0012BD0D0D